MDKKSKPSPEEELIKRISSDAENKIRSKKDGKEVMFGLGLFGIVGWSVAIPTLVGIGIGVYLDNRFEPSFSWTITLLFLGVIVGCLNAWHWIKDKSDNGRR